MLQALLNNKGDLYQLEKYTEAIRYYDKDAANKTFYVLLFKFQILIRQG